MLGECNKCEVEHYRGFEMRSQLELYKNEATGLDMMPSFADLKAQGVQLVELQIDRAYLSSKLVLKRTQELNIYCKAWPVRNQGGRFTKSAFVLDWERQQITCPNQVTVPFQIGTKVQFPRICLCQLSLASTLYYQPAGT